MPSKRTRARPGKASAGIPPAVPQRRTNGTFQKGFSGSPGGDAGRARRALNLDTIREMHLAFQRGGRQAVDKVMKNNPAVFLKLLVLLVPREMEVTHSGGVKAMSDEAIAQAIEAIESALARRSGDQAKVIEGSVTEGVADEPSSTPT